MLNIFNYPFFWKALAGVLLISVAAAMIGTYIISRRMVSITGGVTHACFGGLGLGYFLGVSPVLMATAFAVASSVGVEWMSSRWRVREDSAIAVIWAVGMAVGVLFMFLTPGYVPELNSFLFGNVLTINVSDIITFAIYTAALIAFFAIFFRRIVACAFDRDFAQVIGLRVKLINIAMTVFVAICIVLTIRLVGIMMLMSMMSLPMMAAELWCRRFKSMMFASVAISITCCLAGLLAATCIDVPCSALIVIIMVAVYAILKALKILIFSSKRF